VSQGGRATFGFHVHRSFFTAFGELVGMGGFHTGAENLVFSGMVKMSRKKSCWGPTEGKEGLPSSEDSAMFVIGVRRCCCCLGSSCSREKSHEEMMLGTSNIVNSAGTCSGINERKRVHKSWLYELWSLDKVSVTLLQSPGNHCEYKQVSDSMIRGASFLATTRQMEDSDGCIESENFDFFSHHASDCDGMQFKHLIDFDRISIQIEMTNAKSLRYLYERS
jgi:hypothetical protein